MAKHKKHKKAHHMRRNAAAATASIPRAIVVRRKPTATELAEAEHARQQEDSRGWRVINALGGGVATTIAGALLEHQAALPPKWVTLAIAGLGGALALGAPNRTVRSLGVGAATAGTALLGRILVDEELFKREEKKDDHPQVATSSPTAKPPTPGKRPSNATDIPADALARAYERARLKMALASEPPN